MPPPSSAPPTPSLRRVSRDDVVSLSRSARAWDFLPVVMQVLSQAPQDGGLRVLAAAAAARLRLRTLALELLDGLAEEVCPTPQVLGLRAAAELMEGDLVSREDRTRCARANIEALRARGADLPDWPGLTEGDLHRAADGNIVRRGSGEPLKAWSDLADHAGAAAAFVREHFGERAPQSNDPVTLEGARPPWLLLALWRATPRQPDGSERRLAIVQTDSAELFEALELADLRDVIRDARTSWFIGERASEALAEDLARRVETRITGPCIPLLGTRRCARPPVHDVLRGAIRAQFEEHSRLRVEVSALYAGRDRAWWARRFEEAQGGGAGEPLRVLVPTCRYSTFIRHSSEDLVRALTEAGCEARLLIEPDDASHFSSLAYLRALRDLAPDLVILINYTRGNMGDLFPPNLPFVCWIQDAMPQQLEARAGRAQGEFDFVAGHLHEDLFTRFGFPRRGTLGMPVVACPRKFHAGDVPAGARRRFECEIAMVSHHAATPAQMVERLRRGAGAGPIARALDLLLPLAERAAREAAEVEPGKALRDAATQALRAALGQDPPDDDVCRLFLQAARPLAERFIRHGTLEWAAAIADRRGWRLRIFGRGWEDHPTLARFAGGETAHGEDLRACYASAGVHLHPSLTTLVHQRVMECALSGGLPVVSLYRGVTSGARAAAIAAARTAGAPIEQDGSTGRVGIHVADTPDGLAYAGLRQRLGLAVEPVLWTSRRKFDTAAPPPLAERPDRLLGDLSEVGFRDERGLERLVERSVADPAWRRGQSALIAARVRAELTTDVFVRRVLDLVRGSLGAP